MAKTNNLNHVGGGYYELPNGERVRGKANAQAALEALGSKTSSRPDPNPELATTTKKSLDSMTDAHRRHIERWEPFLGALDADHVWAATPRTPGRNATSFYLAVKFGPKDYGIVGFDTESGEVEDLGVARVPSPKTILAEFRPFRVKAKAERDAARKSNEQAKAKAKTVKKTVKKAKAS